MNSTIATYAFGAIAAFIATVSLVLANDPTISGFASLSMILVFVNGYKLGNAIGER